MRVRVSEQISDRVSVCEQVSACVSEWDKCFRVKVREYMMSVRESDRVNECVCE